MVFGNIYDDLAIIDFKTAQFQMLTIAKYFGSAFHLVGLSDNGNANFNQDWVVAQIADRYNYQVVKFNLITKEKKILAKSPIPSDPVEFYYHFGIQRINHFVYYKDSFGYLQLLNLNTEMTYRLAPVVDVGGIVLPPLSNSENNILIYWFPNEDKSINPIIFDLKSIDNSLQIKTSTITDSNSNIYDSNLRGIKFWNAQLYIDANFIREYLQKYREMQKYHDNSAIWLKRIFPKSKKAYMTENKQLLFQADLNLDQDFELYRLDLNENNSELQLLSNRYFPYGGIGEFYQDKQGHSYFMMSLLYSFHASGGSDKTFFFKWKDNK